MADSLKWQSQQPAGKGITPLFILAGWQLKQTWRLLLVTAIGMVAAVVLVCSAPLYSRVALSAGLRSLVSSDTYDSSVLVYGALQRSGLSDALSQIDDTIQLDMGEQVKARHPLIIQLRGQANGGQTPGLVMVKEGEDPRYMNDLQSASALVPQIGLISYDQMGLDEHVELLEGKLPQIVADENVLEIALPEEVAKCLYYTDTIAATCATAKIGDEIKVVSPYFVSEPIPSEDESDLSPEYRTRLLFWNLRVVGIFNQKDVKDPFWHNRYFEKEALNEADEQNLFNPALITTEQLLEKLDTLPNVPGVSQTTPSQTPGQQSVGPQVSFFANNAQVYAYYPFNIERLEADLIDELILGLDTFEADAKLNNDTLRVLNVATPKETLAQYEVRLNQAQLPVMLLLIAVTGMVLLFISVMTQLLVERQTNVIAVLRSRGASRRQIFGIFTAQNLVLAVLVLFIGPLLAIPVAVLLVKTIFTASDMGAISLITADPLMAAWNIRDYALVALGITLLVSLFTLFRATSLDVLALRREGSRSSRPSLWQRFHVDIMLAVLALGGYGYTLYALNTGVLDDQTSIEILSPLVLLSSMLFLLAALLLFLRVFPRVAQWAAHQASRQRGAAPMLALAQIARSPHQAQRIILLLTLTMGLTIFALVYSATQSQRIVDVANFQVGADYSGWLDTNSGGSYYVTAEPKSLAERAKGYQKLAGVESVALGTMSSIKLQDEQVTLKAVDTDSYAKTIIWSSHYSSQPLPELMTTLRNQRASAQQDGAIPAIVDSETWRMLNLSQNSVFTVPWNNIELKLRPVQQVEYIPTINSSLSVATFSSRSILLDYETLNTHLNTLRESAPEAEKMDIPTLNPNYIWIQAKSGTVSTDLRASLQESLQSGTVIFDRAAFINAMQNDPITLNLVGGMLIGTVTPLLLALAGSLLISWFNTRTRLMSFSILRALGTTSRQMIGVLSWEQCVIYLLMLGLGMLAGIILSAMVLPSLILSSVIIMNSEGGISSSPSIQQGMPTLQMVIPPSLLLVLGILVVVCILALAMMIRMITHPSLSQILRLNSD